MRALLLLVFGGPRSLDEVEPFLTRLMKGRKPSSEQLEKVKERYRVIGGCSPLPEITFKQAKSLEEKLNSTGYRIKSYVGMRYGHPFIEEALTKIFQDGIREVIVIPMTPFRSRETTGAYVEEVNRVQKHLGEDLKIFFIEGWHMHPLFLKSVQEKVREGLMEFTPEERKRVHLLFTAHSLPKSIVEKDPYAREIKASIEKVVEGIHPVPWSMAYQSKGGGAEEWVGPDVESVLEDLSRKKIRNILIVPIGFVSDHIEIFYDIDILCRRKAESLGMVMKRTSSLNSSERFIEALSTIVEEHLNGS